MSDRRCQKIYDNIYKLLTNENKIERYKTLSNNNNISYKSKYTDDNNISYIGELILSKDIDFFIKCIMIIDKNYYNNNKKHYNLGSYILQIDIVWKFDNIEKETIDELKQEISQKYENYQKIFQNYF